MELPREEVLDKPLAEVMAAVKLQESRAAARRLIKVCCCPEAVHSLQRQHWLPHGPLND